METDDYKRGKLDATVAEHAKHLDKINGSLETIARQMKDISDGMLRAAEKASGRDAIAVNTAQVVKDTRQAAIDKSEAGWKPWQRIFAAIVGIAALIGIGVAVAKWVH